MRWSNYHGESLKRKLNQRLFEFKTKRRAEVQFKVHNLTRLSSLPCYIPFDIFNSSRHPSRSYSNPYSNDTHRRLFLEQFLAFIFPICQIALNSLLPLSVSLHLDIILFGSHNISHASPKSKVVSSCSVISGASLTSPLFPN
ncbi:hypothetical protein L1887_20681 [Cichorium endivia]|nr:hypothetical protein L1887_20681 [Cichorium endivia]